MKKSLFLLCFLPFSLAFLNNNLNNNLNNKKSNVNDISYNVKNNFDTFLETGTLGAFHSYSVNTGWKVLISGSDLQDNISRYKHFVLGDEVSFSLFTINCNFALKDVVYKYTQFKTSKYLINNTVTSKEFYFDGHDYAGYYQAKVTYYFKLVNNTVFFNVDSYSYAGWCYSVIDMFSDTTLNSNSFLTFF